MLDRVLNIPQVLNIPRFCICKVYTRFLKKCCTIYAWQDSKYSSSSEYGRYLNMPRLHKVLKKMLHYKYLIVLQFSNVRVTETCEFCVKKNIQAKTKKIWDPHLVLTNPQHENVLMNNWLAIGARYLIPYSIALAI